MDVDGDRASTYKLRVLFVSQVRTIFLVRWRDGWVDMLWFMVLGPVQVVVGHADLEYNTYLYDTNLKLVLARYWLNRPFSERFCLNTSTIRMLRTRGYFLLSPILTPSIITNRQYSTRI